MRGFRTALLTLAALAVVLSCVRSARADDPPSRARVGEKIANIALKNEAGKEYRLYDLKDRKAIVLVFLSFECPVSNSYAQPLADMAAEYGKHGVTLWGLTTNEDETRAQVAKHARDYKLPFPVFKDEKFRAAQALQAEVTPEVFVLDGNFVLRYRGRIDDAYSERLKRHAKVTRQELLQVLGELLSGRPVSVAPTRAIGCLIPRHEKAVAKSGTVTYHRDVVPILQANCQSCHRPGEVGPFSLLTYKQAVNWADDIKAYTQKRLMPPWKPAASVPFHNDRRMSDKDIATLAAWVDGGMPEGNLKDAPAPKQFPQGWQLGTPDLVLTASDDFTLGPTGSDVFRCFVLPTNLKEDVYVSAVEVRPSNARVVHHALLFIDTTGAGRKLEKTEQERRAKRAAEAANDAHAGAGKSLDGGPGYSVAMGVGFLPQGGLSGWAPGHLPRHVPEGVGYRLPKGSDVVMQIHYHRNGRTEKDRTQVGLYFSKKPVERPYQAGVLAGGAGSGLLRLFFSIPAGKEDFKVVGDTWATGDFTLFSVMPHMHMLGKKIKVTMTPPDGPEQTLIAIDDWDYNWQETYLLKEPIQIKKGTRFHVEALYDNSAKNPRNPFNPPRRINFGEQTTNEMCFVFFGGYSNTRRRNLPMTPNAPKKDAARATAP